METDDGGTYYYANIKKTTKKKEKRCLEKERRKAFGFEIVGRTDGVCLVALIYVQAGHLRTCLPQAA